MQKADCLEKTSCRKVRIKTQYAFISGILVLFCFIFHEVALEGIDVAVSLIRNRLYAPHIDLARTMPSERIEGIDVDIVRSIQDFSSFFVPLGTLHIDLILATEDTPHTEQDTSLLDLIAQVIETYMTRTLIFNNSSSVFASVEVSKSYHRRIGLHPYLHHNGGSKAELILPEDNIHDCIDTALNSLGKRYGTCASCKHMKIIGELLHFYKAFHLFMYQLYCSYTIR